MWHGKKYVVCDFDLVRACVLACACMLETWKFDHQQPQGWQLIICGFEVNIVIGSTFESRECVDFARFI